MTLASSLHISVLALQRVRSAHEALALPLPPVLQDLPDHGWLPLRDAQAWLRDGAGQLLAPPLRFQLGVTTLQQWFHEGGGYAQTPSALQVLRYHCQPEGLDRFARGADEARGAFRLESLDEDQGVATVASSTPFDREWERGLLQGALDAPGDLLYSDASWEAERGVFQLRFVSEDNRPRIPWALGEAEEAKVWRLRNRVRQLEQNCAFLEARVLPEPSARGAGASSAWLDPASGAADEAHLLERLRALGQQPLPPSACLIAYGLAQRPSPQQLRHLGLAGQAVTRRADLLARLGEHDLVLLLVDIDVPAARRIARRMTERLGDTLGPAPLRSAVLPWQGGSEEALLALAKAALSAS